MPTKRKEWWALQYPDGSFIEKQERSAAEAAERTWQLKQLRKLMRTSEARGE